MPDSSATCQVPLTLLLQSIEKLIQHNEIEISQALLQIINASDAQRTNKTQRAKYYIDVDYHTGHFEVFRTDNDELTAFFESKKEAEEFIKKHE